MKIKKYALYFALLLTLISAKNVYTPVFAYQSVYITEKA